MKKSAFTVFLWSITFVLYATPDSNNILVLSDFPQTATSISKQYSHLEVNSEQEHHQKRTILAPTHVVRINGSLKDQKLSCEEVKEHFESFFSNQITHDKFYYNTLFYCQYEQSTELAQAFSINSYFDPIDNDAVMYLKNYLETHQDKDFLGTPFHIEEALFLAVSLNIDAGIKKDPDGSTITRYRRDNKSHYFANNFDMLQNLGTDIYKRFYRNDRELILPFLQEWFYSYSNTLFEPVLKISNYVLLQPEKLFIMKEEPQVYTSPLRMYYAHNCEKYENKRCL